MKDNDLQQLRTFLLDELRQIYSKTSVSLWLEPMKISSFNDGEVIIVFPEERKGFVEVQYYDIIKLKLEEIIGTKIKLTFLSEEEEAIMFLERVQSYKKEEKPEESNKPVSAYKDRFNPEYTFANFVVGKSNQLAQSAALAVAKHPAELNNPLFVYGPSGLGKTHLLFAIVNEIRENFPNYNILYVTGEEFTNELVEALTFKKPVAFREKYRNVDVLLVDDIQFIAGKMSVQEEFFHTFDALFKMNKQIILASDCAPKDINNLEERLKSRFVMGLVADVQPPDLELRVAIFKRKAMDYHFELDMEVLYYLAQNISLNIRQIEGALKKLKAHMLITGQECNLTIAKEILSEFFVEKRTEESIIDRIFAYTEKRFGITPDELKSSKRNAEIIAARHFAIYLIRKTTNLSQTTIAKTFNKKDHTTVINSILVIDRKIQEDPVFKSEVQQIIAELRNG